MPDTDLELERELTGVSTCSRAATGLTSSRTFALTGDKAHYARDLVVDVRHIKLEITIDPKAKHHRRHRDAHRRAPSTTASAASTFDAVEMAITQVTVGGQAGEVRLQRSRAARRPAAALKAGAETDIAITYSAKPRRGLYFTAPDEDYPKKPLQAWTQGQDEDSRHWFPCFDFPNDQQTTEVIVTVPAR